jgi:hypothetical protein
MHKKQAKNAKKLEHKNAKTRKVTYDKLCGCINFLLKYKIIINKYTQYSEKTKLMRKS